MKNYLLASIGLLAIRFTPSLAAAVVDLTEDSFDEVVNSHRVVMVEFFAPWCGVCSDLEPIYEQTASELDPAKDILFARVDCVAEPGLCQRFSTPIFPTLRLFQATENHEIYNGVRTPYEMTSQAERRYRPLVSSLQYNAIEGFKALDNVTIVGYLDQNDAESRTVLSSIAKKHLDYITFGTVDEPSAAEAEGVAQPGIVLYKKYDEGRVVYNGAFEEESLNAFIDAASIPDLAELENKFSQRYVGPDRPVLAGLFAASLQERNSLADIVRPVATKFRDSLRFAAIDPALTSLTRTFGVTDGSLPAFAIREDNGNKFVLDPKGGITRESIDKFVDDYLKGNLMPYFKSEAVPETQDGPVFVAVRDTFQELVIDVDADVLVEFYAPWCGHCKKLAPIYERLAQIYAEHAPNIRVAKVDAAANEISGHLVSSYPTIKFFPAGNKSAVVQYSGNRSIEHLAEFVKENSAMKTDISPMLSIGEQEQSPAVGVHAKDEL